MNTIRAVKFASALAALFSASQVLAGPLSISDITGDWSSPVFAGAGPTSVSNNPAQATDEIRWGVPANPGNLQSGYDFTPAGDPGVVALDTPFLLGTFNHLNFPITSISLLQVNYDLSFMTNGVPVAVGPLTVLVEHDETPNAPCPDPGCPDEVTASSPAPQASIITQGSDVYLFRLVGWSLTNDGQNIGGLSLTTIENQQNIAYLYAEITTARVPEPGLLSLLGLGLLGLGATRLRKSSRRV